MVTETSTQGSGLAQSVQAARQTFESLTGRQVESVSGAIASEGRWQLTFEVVELARIPESTSLLGSYEVTVDDEGNLLEYGRVRRYYRNRADEDL
jgi:hypothetical protein